MTEEFATKYGPWAIVVGASDGVGALFAERIASEGVNVVLVARRQHVLDEVAEGIQGRTGAQTLTLTVDLTNPDASTTIIDATAGIDIGMLVYCAGGDPNYQPFLANPVTAAEAAGPAPPRHARPPPSRPPVRRSRSRPSIRTTGSAHPAPGHR